MCAHYREANYPAIDNMVRNQKIFYAYRGYNSA